MGGFQDFETQISYDVAAVIESLTEGSFYVELDALEQLTKDLAVLEENAFGDSGAMSGDYPQPVIGDNALGNTGPAALYAHGAYSDFVAALQNLRSQINMQIKQMRTNITSAHGAYSDTEADLLARIKKILKDGRVILESGGGYKGADPGARATATEAYKVIGAGTADAAAGTHKAATPVTGGQGGTGTTPATDAASAL